MSYENAYADKTSDAYGNNTKGGGNPYGNERDAYKKRGNPDDAYKSNGHQYNNYNQFGYDGRVNKNSKSIKGSLALLSIVAIGIVYILYFS